MMMAGLRPDVVLLYVIFTLCESFLHISPDTCKRVLRDVSWGRAGGGGSDGHGHGAAGSVGGRGVC